MKVLVLNGSPKGNKSFTLTMTELFLEGIRKVEPNLEVDVVCLLDKEIKPCRGCEACWRTTPGKCVIKDDAIAIHEKYITADLIIWSFPLYLCGVPSHTKACMDRIVFPCLMPQMAFNEDGVIFHPFRNRGAHQRQVLISSCGFPQIEHNYDGLIHQMRIVNRNITNIICAAAPAAWPIPQSAPYKERVEQYKKDMKQAGVEYLRNGSLSIQLINRLKEPMAPAEEFMDVFNALWGDW